MGKPGQGASMSRSLIIDSPSLQTLRRRFAFNFVTFLFWVVWFYLWMPLVTLIAWTFGLQVVYEHMIVLEGWKGLSRLLTFYFTTITALGFVFIGWALYNNIRFRNKKRRGNGGRVEVQDLVDFYHVGPEMVAKGSQSKRVVVHFNPEGGIVNMECDLPMN